MHKNAKTTPHIREKIVRDYRNGVAVSKLSRMFELSESWIHRLIRRFEKYGDACFRLKSSRPHTFSNALSGGQEQAIKALALGGWPQWRIAEVMRVSEACVSKVLKRLLGKSWRKRREPVVRYEYEAPGELLHIDIKRVSRFEQAGWKATGCSRIKSKGAGYEYVHVCVDDYSRWTMAEQLHDQKGETAATFMESIILRYRALGVTIERVMTDNGPCYKSNAFKAVIEKYNIKHIFTRPFRPQTNGKAERFIKTLMNEWGYGKRYESSDERKRKLPCYLNWFNLVRKHGSLTKKPPVSRLIVNNVCEVYT